MNVMFYQNRIGIARKSCRKKGFYSFIFTCASDIRYLSGFDGADSRLLLLPRKCILITDSRYTLQAFEQCPACRIVERKGSITKETAEILNKSPAGKLTGIDSSVSVRAYRSLKKVLAHRLKPAESPAVPLRQIKDDSEVSAIKAAAKIAERSVAKALAKIRHRISETELAGMIDFEIRKAGTVNSFETIVAFGANGAMAHHRPSKRRLKKNDCILIDFGTVYNGYCCDITRCFAVGKISRSFAKAYKAVLQAQTAAIAAVKNGVRIARIERCAKDVLEKYNLPAYGHGTGHGIGLNIHESPVISSAAKGKLETGQVITIEPGVYIEGKFGIRIEDDILVTPTGAKILTSGAVCSDRVACADKAAIKQRCEPSLSSGKPGRSIQTELPVLIKPR